MLPFGITTVEFALVTFLSALTGISLMIAASRFVKARFLAAFSLGVYLWYFTDTLGDANYLDVLNGPAFSWNLVALLALFAVGLLVFIGADGGVFSAEGGAKKYGMLVAAAVALAVGLHGFGEGADFGFTAAQTHINTLLGAFGGLTEGASWMLHKAVEPSMAAACYVALAGGGPKKLADRVIDASTMAAVFVAPAVAGSVVGYFTSFDHTYAFALGLGASVYALARIGKMLYTPHGETQRGLSVKMAVSFLVGFALIFLAALLHA